MVRTRHVAVAFALAAATTPFILSSPASAAESELTVAGGALSVFTGASPLIDFNLGDEDPEAGPYSVDLFKGDDKIATISSGTDVTALNIVKWTIPTGVSALVGPDMSVHVTSTATDVEDQFPAVESDPFTIAPSSINGVMLVDFPEDEPVPTFSVAAGSSHTLLWEKFGATGSKVNVELVQTVDGKAKKISLLKDTANDGSEDVTLPVKAIVGDTVTANKIVVTPSNKAATAGESDDLTITAASAGTVKIVAPGEDADSSAITTAVNGDTITVTWTAVAPVQLDLYLEDATKPAAKIAKSVTGGTYDFEIPAKLAAGTYSVKATVIGVKPAVTADSGTLDIAQPLYEAPDVTGPLNQGETVTLEWSSDGNDDSTGLVTVSLVSGTKLIKIDGKATTVNGVGSIEWLVPAKQAAGSYSIRIQNNNVKAGTKDSFADTDAFSIVANSTTMAPTTTPPTTTTAAPTTTTAAPTTTTTEAP